MSSTSPLSPTRATLVVAGRRRSPASPSAVMLGLSRRATGNSVCVTLFRSNRPKDPCRGSVGPSRSIAGFTHFMLGFAQADDAPTCRWGQGNRD